MRRVRRLRRTIHDIEWLVCVVTFAILIVTVIVVGVISN